jgi:NAD(P)-dependent dehydrogenase (short-subunit alcohol dehydrogenase family)
MEKKVIIITGGSSGIGKYIVKNLLKNKFYVINLTRKPTFFKSIRYHNYCLKDFSNEKDLNNFFFNTKKRFKKIYALINNVGGTFDGYESSRFRENIEINLNFTFDITSKFIDILKNGGKIINISSIASIVSLPNNPGYNASKAAINSLTRSFANDYADRKINVNSLILGYFPTKMTRRSFKNDKKNSRIIKNTILGRWGKLKDIYGPLEFLLSSKSDYITGQSIIVDGGWTIKGMK